MTKPPQPGQAVRGSESGRPLMALFDLVGRRWTMRLLWELNQAPATFRDLQSRCEQLSSSVLNTRIAELRAVGLISQQTEGYRLTPIAVDLMKRIAPLRTWAEQWAEELEARQKLD